MYATTMQPDAPLKTVCTLNLIASGVNGRRRYGAASRNDDAAYCRTCRPNVAARTYPRFLRAARNARPLPYP
jgi:hypothetical protein